MDRKEFLKRGFGSILGAAAVMPLFHVSAKRVKNLFCIDLDIGNSHA